MIPEIKRGKSRFIAKSAMSFAQFIGTAGLATQLFEKFSASWRMSLVAAIIVLVIFAVILYPNENGKNAGREESE